MTYEVILSLIALAVSWDLYHWRKDRKCPKCGAMTRKEDKQVANQNVLTEQQNLAQIQVKNQETVSQAQAQHDSNALLEQSLTPAILQKMAIDKWNGTLPTVTSSGYTPFISIPTK